MNFGDIVTAVQRQSGDSAGAVFTRPDILRWANEGQLYIVRKTECLQSHKETGTQSTDNSYELPDDFLFMKRATLDNLLLTERSIDDLDLVSSYVDTVSSGTSLFYYLWNQVLTLFPSPQLSGSGNLDIWYVKAPLPLLDDNDVPEIPVWMHKDLVHYCRVQAKELDDDLVGMTKLQDSFNSNIAETQYELQSQPLSSYPSVRALPGDM